MMTNEKAVAEKLLQAQAVQLRPAQPFTWASGWKSPIYCDNRRILGFPYLREFVKSELCNVLFQEFEEAGLLGGGGPPGLVLGGLAACQRKVRYFFVRPKPKEHGMGNQIEGYYQPGQPVVVIEDLVSTGKSSLQVVEVLKQQGLQVLGMVSIFTYGFPQAQKAFEAAGLRYQALTSYEVLLQLAVEKGLITEAQLDTLQSWRQSPATWQG